MPIEIRSTRHGPVVAEHRRAAATAEGGDEREVLALAATYLADDDATPEAALGVNSAGSWPEFVTALSQQKVIQQNVGYADVDGNIGFIAPGRVPVRERDQGLVPAPGWTGDADWQGYVPFAALPQVLNPPADLIINANNRIVGPNYPWYLGSGWDAGFRAQRIAELLSARRAHTVDSMVAMQMDTVSLMAATLLPLMLDRMPAVSRHARVLARLRTWSAYPDMAPDRPEPLIFSSWLRAFNEAIAADKLGELFALYWGYRPLFVERVLRDRPLWCDRPVTPEVEDCLSRLEQSLDRAMSQLEADLGESWQNWRWDSRHEARFDHLLFGRLPVVRSLANVRTPVGGGNDTIMRAASNIISPDHPFAAIHGAAFRAVYDLADLARSLFVIAPGQSGNPLSVHYRDLLSLWREGSGVALAASIDQLEAKARARLVLMPESTSGR